MYRGTPMSTRTIAKIEITIRKTRQLEINAYRVSTIDLYFCNRVKVQNGQEHCCMGHIKKLINAHGKD